MSEDDTRFLSRRQWEPLRRTLASIPALVEDLAITLTRQDHVGRSDLGKPSKRRPESSLPMNENAADVATELRNCLAGWVRMVIEQRGIEWSGGDDIATLATWLRKNVVALAMTEGSAEAAGDIASHVDAARRIVDLPEGDVVIDKARVEAANRQILTAGQIEKIARKLGELGTGLTKNRVHSMVRAGKLKATAKDGTTMFFALGDVLDAHHRHDGNDDHPKRSA